MNDPKRKRRYPSRERAKTYHRAIRRIASARGMMVGQVMEVAVAVLERMHADTPAGQALTSEPSGTVSDGET